MDEHYTYDYLPGTDIYLYQHKDMFRNNTDTALLGNFMKIRKRDRVLDIGTNNAALLLYASQYHPASLTGVEINEQACIIARKNMEHHNLLADIQQADILACKLPSFTCIVCNPPYFKIEDSGEVNVNEHVRNARHETKLDLTTLLPRVAQLLEDRGRFYMVHRADRFIDIACLMRSSHMEIKTVQFVYDEAKDEARSVLIEAMRNGKANCKILSPHIIKREG